MILTRTPLRISLVGGGTDLPSFYRKHGGAVVSFTIDKYVYTMVNKPMENKVRVSYSQTENVVLSRDVKHTIVRACLEKMGIFNNIEITFVSDVPGCGTGMGSSSAITVGLLNALTQYCIENDLHYDPIDLAKEACDVEINMLNKPIGKQDQYACAYGGLNFFGFNQDESVDVRRINLRDDLLEELNSRLMLFYTGRTRSSADVLTEQNKNIEERTDTAEIMLGMKNLAVELYEQLLLGNISSVGDYLYQNWLLKRRLASSITNDDIDKWYQTALWHGAEGGKLLGAGGGGFMLFYVPKKYQRNVILSMPLRYVPFKIVKEGSRMIFPMMEDNND